jgi:anti-sigma regulatory factor (Ser/Thr protein kinase)
MLTQAELQTAGRARREPHHELRLVAEPAQLSRARRLADDVGEAFGLDERQRYDFTFAVNEAVTNAIEHGAPSSDGTVRVWTAEEKGALVCYVEDFGTFNPPCHAMSDRGRGLALIATMVDEMNVSSGEGRTLVRLSKQLARA